MKLRDVVAVAPLQGFSVHVTFDNGVTRTIDLTRYIAKGEAFAPVRDNRALFEQVAVVRGALTWPNDTDLDTEVLYYDLPPAGLL